MRWATPLACAGLVLFFLTGCSGARWWTMGVDGAGERVQCADGKWSNSGGIQGACSHHGGVSMGDADDGVNDPSATGTGSVREVLPGYENEGLFQYRFADACAAADLQSSCFSLEAIPYDRCSRATAQVNLLDDDFEIVRVMTDSRRWNSSFVFEFDYDDPRIMRARLVNITCDD